MSARVLAAMVDSSRGAVSVAQQRVFITDEEKKVRTGGMERLSDAPGFQPVPLSNAVRSLAAMPRTTRRSGRPLTSLI